MVTHLSKAELLNEINTALSVAIDPAFSSRAAEWDLYEVYTFCLIVEEAEEANAQVTFMNSNNSPATALTFRISPSSIINTGPFTHALLEFPDKKPLEAHVGVYVSEKSLERTECDVCVIHKSEADFFRNRRVKRVRNKGDRRWPDGAKVEIAVECKYLTQNLGAGSTHEFMGRCWGLGAKRFHLVTNTPSEAAGHRVRSGPGGFVWQHDVIPPSTRSITRFRGVLRQEFDDYQTHISNKL